MLAPFPTVDERFKDDAAERDMGLLMDIIGTVRNIKGEKGISPSKKLKAMVMTEEQNLLPLLHSGTPYIVNLARLENLAIVSAGEELEMRHGGRPRKVFVVLKAIDVRRAGPAGKEMAKIEKDSLR
jgi:valyl-tRNA synthetase